MEYISRLPNVDKTCFKNVSQSIETLVHEDIHDLSFVFMQEGYIVLSITDLLILFQVEEKMRVDHERKSIKMKHMDVRGSESHKVEAARTLVRSLSTKIKVAIQVVDKISMRINRLRDEELWPQLHDFIQGYLYSKMPYLHTWWISLSYLITDLCLLLSYYSIW